MNKSFIMYSHYYETISKLSYEEQGKLAAAIYEYNIYGEVKVELSEIAKIIFSFVRVRIDDDCKKYNLSIKESLEKKRVKEEKREERAKRKRKEKEAKRKDKEEIELEKEESRVLKEESYLNYDYIDTPSNPIINNCLLSVCKEKEGAPEHATRTREEKRPRFVPPTVEEVRAYCTERQNGIDAFQFVDFYTANGWVQARGKPIKDWRAAVRTWEQRNKQRNNEIQASPPSKPQKPRFGEFDPKEALANALKRTYGGG